MMETLIISPLFPPEPVVSAKLSFDIANALSAKGPVTVISQRPSRPYGFSFSPTKPEFSFNHIQTSSFISPRSALFGRMYESYSFGKHCYRYIAENHKKIKVIYANTWPLLAQCYTVSAARKYMIPVIIHVQDIYPESITNKLPLLGPMLNLFLMPTDRYVLRYADRIIAVSEKMKMHISQTRKIRNDKISIVRNWQDEEEFLKQHEKEKEGKRLPGPFTFMYLGNIGAVAGVELLVDSFIKAGLKNSRLVIAGSGPMKEALEKNANSNKNNNIEFWPVPDGKVAELQSKADVLLLPVRKGAAHSSIPSKLPAYMFSGKPIIACVDADSDSAECIKEAGCGFVLEPENTSRLASCMAEIIAMPSEQLNKMGKSGFDYASRYMSRKVNLDKITSIVANPQKITSE